MLITDVGDMYMYIYLCVLKDIYINLPVFMRHCNIYYTPNLTHYDSVP